MTQGYDLVLYYRILMIVFVDYGIYNLSSILNILKKVGANDFISPVSARELEGFVATDKI